MLAPTQARMHAFLSLTSLALSSSAFADTHHTPILSLPYLFLSFPSLLPCLSFPFLSFFLACRYPKMPVVDGGFDPHTCVAFDLMRFDLTTLSGLPGVVPLAAAMLAHDDDDQDKDKEEG